MKPAPIAWSLVAIFLLGGTLARAQSLADLAKKEEERRRAAKGPAKVYTNDDLKKYPTPPTPPEGQPPTTGAVPAVPAVPAPADANPPDAAKPADPSKPAEPPKPAAAEEKKDEAYWKGLITAARTKLERDESYLEALQTRINSLTNDFYARDDPAQRGVIETQRNKALVELARLKQDVVEGKANIAKIQEDARKEGVPPGWLR